MTKSDRFLAADVVRWWTAEARDLPWRASRDPWEILVSETMLQQTQVARVVPAWHRFLDRFPTVEAAAATSAGDLIDAWTGLGYNRRAVQLHECARAVVDRHDGRLPPDLDLLLELPGVGPYTARAILAFAFEHDVAVVDTNVGRVLARWFGRVLGRREVQELADSLVGPGMGWEWNQAILDFGALHCTKRTPDCQACPVVDGCAWRGVGPDPAIGSAGVGRGQSTFAGSDRQGRGAVVDALRAGPVGLGELGAITGWIGDAARVERVVEGLVRDGLAVRDSDTIRLP